LENDLLDAKPTNFCVGVSGYPEKHFESPNLKIDVKYTKDKIQAGAEYIVTQMFFDNSKYFNYVELCKEEGINVPIIPGLKIITSKTQLTNLPRNFHIDIPEELSEEILCAKNEYVLEIGVNWAAKQVEELLNNNVPSLHFYIMQNSKPILMLMDKLKL
ncbi:MAG: methylenetetrahydrofolate reductase, partial [Clostridiales bacterium]